MGRHSPEVLWSESADRLAEAGLSQYARRVRLISRIMRLQREEEDRRAEEQAIQEVINEMEQEFVNA